MNIRKIDPFASTPFGAGLKLHVVGRAARQALSTPRRANRWEGLLLGALTAAAAPGLWAAPDGGLVTTGQAQIGRAGTLTTITQQSQRAVIDWRSFNVGAAEAVNFRQPDATAVTLNRVLGPDASAILGRLTANGSVFIVNPNGVLFGPNAQVNVGGLVASTANISNANFMAGNYRFDQPSPNAAASVRNEGVIRVAANGIAALVGRQVSNSGFIVADLGKVALAGGDAFVLDLGGDRLVNLILDASLMEQLTDAQGQPLIARVDNTGNIRASGGRVELTADTVSTMLNNVINVGGDIRATSMQARDGVISLTGGATTGVRIAGIVQAGGTAGRVDVAGRDIVVASTAQVDLGLGADVNLSARRDLTLDASINALRDGSVAGGSLTATAGNDLTVNQALALNDAALTLTATGGRVSTASRALLQTGSGALNVAGSAGVALHDVLAGAGVDVRSAAGAVDLNGTIVAGGAVRIEAGGSLTVSPGGIRSSGAGSGISLTSTGDLQLQGDLQANAATIALISGGAVTARVLSPGSNPTAVDAVIDAGLDATASRIVVRADGDVTLGGLIAQREADIASANGSVLLLSPLGGSETGYRDYAGGYRGDRPAGTERSRPNVGVLTVGAPNGSVELNGLNLDGLADPMAGGHGLRVTAGHLILSNSKIAVNKGDIVLAGGQRSLTDPSLTPEQRAERERDGVYLGDSIYSRGWDSVGANGQRDAAGGDDRRIGYSITVSGRNLGLFDNTAEVADLPGLYRVTVSEGAPPVLVNSSGFVVDRDGRETSTRQVVTCGVAGAMDCGSSSSLALENYSEDPALTQRLRTVYGTPVSRRIAKIEIANNAANYFDNSNLVPLSDPGSRPRVSIESQEIVGVIGGYLPQSDGAPRPFDLRTFAPNLGRLSEVDSYSGQLPVSTESGVFSSAKGVGLKLLGFLGTTDRSTKLWSSSIELTSGPLSSSSPGGRLYEGPESDLPTTDSVSSGTVDPATVFGGVVSTPDANGVFTVTAAPGRIVDASGTSLSLPPDGQVTYTFRQLDNPRTSFVEIVSVNYSSNIISSNPGAGDPATWTVLPGPLPQRPRIEVGRFTTFRFDPTATLDVGLGGVGTRGSAELIRIVSSLRTAAGLVVVQEAGAGALWPSAVRATDLPIYRQSTNAQGALQIVRNFNDVPDRSYSSGIVLTDVFSGSGNSLQLGTRVFVFDGDLISNTARSVTDGNGQSFVPTSAGRGASGPNFTGTTFTSIGGSVTTAPGTAPTGSFGTGAPTPPDPGFVVRPDASQGSADRASQDALQSAGSLGGAGASTDTADTVEIGIGPAAQADLGRGSGLSGAATNVFKRSYRVASSSGGVVCAPDAIEPTDGAGRRSAPAGTAPTDVRDSAASISRDCKPSGR